MASKKLIYTDAARLDNGDVGIGIYDPQTHTGAYIYLPSTNMTVQAAERYGVELGEQMAKREYNENEILILGDNKNVMSQKDNRSWIPREANKIADKLSKKAIQTKQSSTDERLNDILPGVKNNKFTGCALVSKLRSYSFEQRLNFLHSVAPNKREKEVIECLRNKRAFTKDYNKVDKQFIHLLKTLIVRGDSVDCINKTVLHKEGFKTIKPSDIENVIRKGLSTCQ